MPFFLPRKLTDLEYLGSDQTPDEEAKRYRLDTDFAFFVVNFHMSRADFESLTPTEKALIMKAYENKVVMETQQMNNAVANAVANVMRKKGRPWRPLWKKKPQKADTKELAQLARDIQKKDKDKSWVDRILSANKKGVQ